jgi:energy-coupling factor transporter ATP-binding protein EcfA2
LEMRVSENYGLQITVQTDGKKSYYSQISENTKFLFAYYLYNERESISGDILLFDEPSNGFHPSAQEFILNFLKSLASTQNQVIVATHSEHMIDLDLLSGVRLMGADENRSITVRNSIYSKAKGAGDYLALQPILDAIGYSYARQINIKDKVVITEGITDMLYLRAFNTILRHEGELNIAPSRGDSLILSLIPFFISQGVSFKVLLDTGDVKDLIKDSYGIGDEYIREIPIPDAFIGKMKGSGIEDLFTKDDFKQVLSEIGETVDESYERVSNGHYMAKRAAKRLVAHRLYERAASIAADEFAPETLENFRAVLDFCKANNWFSI